MSAGHKEAAALIAKARTLLASAPSKRDAPFRYPVLATIGQDGAPSARTLVLRGAETESWRLTLHTDRRTGKCRELAARNDAVLVFYDHAEALQVRLKGTVRLSQEDQEWARLPEANRSNYRAEPAPGSPLSEPGDGLRGAYETVPSEPPGKRGFENFAVLRFQADSVDILQLSATGENRRYRLQVEKNEGSWLVP